MYPDHIPAYNVSEFLLCYPNIDRDARIQIREGWLALVEEMLIELKYLFPEIRILNLSSMSWLSVAYDGEHVLDLQHRKRLREIVQGYVTRSLSTCEHCGSQHARHWEAARIDPHCRRDRHRWDRTICEECRPAQDHAAARRVAEKESSDVVR